MLIAIVSALLSATTPSSADRTCRFAGEPRTWTAQALTAWDRLDRRRLHIARPVTPVIALFDDKCVYRLVPSTRGDFRVGQRRYRVTADQHSGELTLPDGNTVPAQRLAFASPMSDGGMFFTMALPSLWRADTDEVRDPRLLSMVVFMHEFTHTQQADGLGSRIDALLANGLPEDADDDVVQDQFQARPGYASGWSAERDSFYASAQAEDPAAARVALRRSVDQMAERRARWFTGADAIYADADDVFLTMEGSGNWSAWAWLTDPAGGRMAPDAATAFIRGAGTHWSQDEGLGAMLAIDRLTPDWPSLAFGPAAATIDDLAARALAEDR
ncbi:MAG TPA: hypothetical protein VF633_12615 [Brevundimonas sp.]|jgi:hypothetical protein